MAEDIGTLVTSCQLKLAQLSSIYFTSSPAFLNVSDNTSTASKILNLNNSGITTASSSVLYNYTDTTNTTRKPTSGTLTLTNLSDINCLKLLSNDPNSIAYKTYMHNLYAWYDICSANNWKDATGSVGYTPKKPSDDQSFVFTKTNNPVISDIATIKNPFVARRLLRLFIMLGNLNIALKSGNSELIADCYQLLKSTNYIINDVSTSVSSVLSTVIQKRTTKFKSQSAKMEQVNVDMIKNKDDFNTSKDLLNNRAAAQKKMKMYEFLALAVFVAIAAAAIGIVVTPIEQKQKLNWCGLLGLVAVVNAVALNYLKSSSLVESFDTNTVILDTTYMTAALREALTYIDNTLGLTHLLESNQAYSNITFMVQKELNYFNDSSEQLVNSKLKVDSVYHASYNKNVQYSSLMGLLISLTIILTGVTAAHVAVEPIAEANPSVRSYILGAGAVLAVISFTIFIMETGSRVHTKPKTFYWGQPPASMF